MSKIKQTFAEKGLIKVGGQQPVLGRKRPNTTTVEELEGEVWKYCLRKTN